MKDNLPRRTLLMALLTAGLLAAGLAGLAWGAAPLSWPQWWGALWREDSAAPTYAGTILWNIRIPRVILGMLVGAGLAVSGACLQAFFRNPLADPVLIGVSGGAAFGAVLFMSLVPPASAALLGMPAAAFVGGIAATLATAGLARVHGRIRAVMFLLCGIAMNALTNAGISFCLFKVNDQQLRSIVFWMMGSLGQATWREVMAAAPFILVSLVILPLLAPSLNALLLGEVEAAHLGVRVERIKQLVIVLSAAAAGAGVAVCGIVGFIGLVVPHLIRMLLGADHRWLLPGCAVLGAALTVASDLVARVAVAPVELPLGVVTAAFGAPFFLWLLLRERGRILF